MINIIDKDEMLLDVCNVLNIDNDSLYTNFKEFKEESNKEGYTNGDTLKKCILDFLQSRTCKKIDNIMFCHLCRLIEVPNNLLPLHKLLTTNNTFSNFLNSNNLQFVVDNDRIIIRNDNKIIQPKEIFDSSKFNNNHTRLAKRLGYLETKDFCINGFLFAVDISNHNNIYFDLLKLSCEFLQDLDKFLKTRLTSQFKEISEYYCLITEASLSEIIFDEQENLTLEEKRLKYLYYCVLFLYDYNNSIEDNHPYLSVNNPILRLGEDSTIKVSNSILLNK